MSGAGSVLTASQSVAASRNSGYAPPLAQVTRSYKPDLREIAGFESCADGGFGSVFIWSVDNHALGLDVELEDELPHFLRLSHKKGVRK